MITGPMMCTELLPNVLVGTPVERLLFMNAIVSLWNLHNCYAIETAKYFQHCIPVEAQPPELSIEHYSNMV